MDLPDSSVAWGRICVLISPKIEVDPMSHKVSFRVQTISSYYYLI